MKQEAVKKMVDHMNDDHSGAVKLYVLAFTKLQEVDSAVLLNIDEQGLDIVCNVNEHDQQVRVDFEKPIAAAEDVRSQLVSMVAKARELLA